MARSFMDSSLHHGLDTRVSVNTAGEVPILSMQIPGGHVSISPSAGWPREPFTEDHLRFAEDLASAAEQYRDVIAGARLWEGLDFGSEASEGAA